MRLPLLVTAFAATLGLTLPQGQDTPTQGRAGEARAGAMKGDVERDDALLATWLLICNENEIELSKLAQQQAESSEVKQFAQKMVQEHGRLSTELQRFASGDYQPGGGVIIGGTTGRDDGREDGRDVLEGRTREASAPRGGESKLDHVALLTDLGRAHLSSAREALQEKDGRAFDMAYMMGAQMAHRMLLDKIQVFEKYASAPELEKALSQARQTTEQHLQHAKRICSQLEGKSDQR